MDGKPLYYKGYKHAIKQDLPVESIRGINSYQAAIISHILSILFNVVDLEKYWLFPGNPGIYLNAENEIVASILVCTESELPASRISTRYIDVPAELHIQVDIRVELEALSELVYIKKKVQKLLDFGTKRVMWIFTGAQKILIATPTKIGNGLTGTNPLNFGKAPLSA
jgi:hypothetical protein